MATRLEKHEVKRLRSRILTLIVLIGLFVIFATTIGLPLLINGSVFIGKLLGGGQTEKEKNTQELGDFSVREIPNATNSAQINVSGNVENVSILEVYLNGDESKELDVEKEQDFSTTIDGLQLGDNQIYFVGKRDETTTIKKSQVYTITYRNQRPKLEVTEPQDNFITPRDEIKVSGKTDPNVTMTVNDSPVIVGSGGDFQTLVKLKEGENKINIVVRDSSGNSDSKELTVKYEK